jgi:hypothetical protein
MEFAGMESNLLARGEQDNRLVHVIPQEKNSCRRSSRSFLGLQSLPPASHLRRLPSTLLKRSIWLLFITADMSERPVIKARFVLLLQYRIASMIQRPPAAAVSAIMQVFASIIGDVESRASSRSPCLIHFPPSISATCIVGYLADFH